MAEDTARAIADWLEEQAGEPIRFEKVAPGEEQVLEGREQEVDALPSRLAGDESD
jgi:hypothetical protein